MNKVKSIDEVIKLIKDNSVIAMGGFGLCGIPENLIRYLAKQKVKNLTIISNNAGTPEAGIGLLINNGQVKKMIASYLGENPVLQDKILAKEIELELIPQGTMAERLRAQGAGLGGFYTPTGAGTVIEKDKEKRVINDKEYILEFPLKADFAFIKAKKADTYGNLVYNKTSRNFNPVMAKAADFVIAEVEDVVSPGSLSSDVIVTPGIFVDAVVKGNYYEKRFQKRIYRKESC